jgi:hypothetical protein
VILPVRAPVMETTDNGEIGYSVYKGETREKPAVLPGRGSGSATGDCTVITPGRPLRLDTPSWR